MNAFRDFKDTIYQLVKAEKYAEALLFFKEEKMPFTVEEIAADNYLVSNILKCLRMTAAYHAAHRFLSIYNITISATTEEKVQIAWILILYDWYKHLNETNKNSDKTLLELSYHMLFLLNHESEFSANFYSTIVQRVLKTESKRTNVNWKNLKTFCEQIAPAHLSTECGEMKVFTKGKEKITELASVQEEWYSQYSKSLFALGEYPLCINICEEALITIRKMHYSNDSWFKRRIAQCKVHTNELSCAIADYEAIVKRKNDWFILGELGILYKQTGEYAKAKETMHAAMLKFGEMNFKAELIEHLAETYNLSGDEATAKEHYKLAAYIRHNVGWKVNNTLLSKAGMASLQHVDKVLETDLLKKLQSKWRESPLTDKPAWKKGKVHRTGNPKEMGTDIWITDENGKQYYSFIKKESPVFQNIRTGSKVLFTVQPMPDRPLDKAVNVRYEK